MKGKPKHREPKSWCEPCWIMPDKESTREYAVEFNKEFRKSAIEEGCEFND